MEKKEISEHRILCLLTADNLARFCIVFPFIFAGRGLQTIVPGLLTGLLFWCLFVQILRTWIRPDQSFWAVLEKRCGREIAAAVCLAGLWYFLSHTAVFVRIWAELLRTGFAREASAAALCAVPFAAGILLLRRRERFRAGGKLGAMLLLLTAVLAVLAADEIPGGAYRSGMGAKPAGTGAVLPVFSPSAEDSLGSGFEVFACLGGGFLPLVFGYPGNLSGGRYGNVSGREQRAGLRCHAGRVICLAGGISAAVAGAFCAAAPFAVSGRDWLPDFPVPGLLQGLRPSGEDVGRLDVVMALILLAGLTLSVAGGLWYVQQCYDYLYKAAVSAYEKRRFAEPQIRLDFGAAGRYRKGLSARSVLLPEYGRNDREEFAGELSGPALSGRVRTFPVGFAKRFSGFVHTAWGHFYGGKMPENLSSRRIGWLLLLLVLFALAAGFRNAFAAVTFYRAYNMQLFMPLTVCFFLAALIFSY